ncbi:MAG: SusD/RagB family nutrient-binding outer membrane lipoprotein [Paludibacter sp.]|nr:SusD/RagB family nutrient-binding outer membrane lipoprotein [Paludibacter sp.]
MKKLLLIMLTCALVLSGCSDEFFDINKSPNSATEDNMTPSLVLPRALHRMADQSATGYREYEFWMGYWARCAGGYGPNTDEEAYQLTSSFKRLAWLDMYDILKDFDVIEKNAVTRNETAYEGIAKIMKSIGYMQLVDQYNNVPYSKAFNLGDYMLTPYDKGEDIYAALITDLEAADELLANAVVADNLDIESVDIVFAGDLDMWRKLGNTQRLRLLIHQTGLFSDAELKTEIDKIVANGAGFLGADETANVQPGYAKDVNKQNPFWNTYNTNDAGGLDNFSRANNYFLKLLKDNDDIRYTRFFTKAASPVTEDYAGFDFGIESQSGQLTASQSSMVSGPGLISGASDPLWLFTSFESLFLQAEAVQRGALAGVAKDAYEAAVKESFAWLGVDATVADAYLTNTSKPIGNWDENSDKLLLITKQKYIAMCGINGLESYTEYRRTGFPTTADILSVRSGITNSIPKRLIYPIEEYNYNAANAIAEGTINPQTATIFWDVN